jgi:3-methyl-2-oxobutanoate hydroxymethyltransferase
MNIFEFQKLKLNKQKLSMVTCYDYWSAKIISESHINLILVGDSAANIMHGHNTTLPISIEMMALHVSAVSKGAPNKFIIADMPFLSYRKDLTTNMNNIEVLMKAGAHAIKIEGAIGNYELIDHCKASGVPVMGHLGLTPQSINMLGGFKVQGKTKEQAEIILEQSLKLESAGCFSLVMECVPSSLGKTVSEKLNIPVIGIGAGPDTDGQVLVMHDLLGLSDQFKPKFLRKFLDGKSLFLEAFNSYHKSVVNKDFPSVEESYE